MEEQIKLLKYIRQLETNKRNYLKRSKEGRNKHLLSEEVKKRPGRRRKSNFDDIPEIAFLFDEKVHKKLGRPKRRVELTSQELEKINIYKLKKNAPKKIIKV
jgi:hypothetical protein